MRVVLVKCITSLGLTPASRLCSALYKLHGDSSGPNCGQLTVAEMAEVAGWTESQLLHQHGRNAPTVARAGKTSAYRGVSSEYAPVQCTRRVYCSTLTLGGRTHKVYVRIHVKGRSIPLGSFDDEEAAARAYDKCVCLKCGAHAGSTLTHHRAARELFGAKAILNFLDEGADGGPAHATAPPMACMVIQHLRPASHNSDMAPGLPSASPPPPCPALTLADLAPPPL